MLWINAALMGFAARVCGMISRFRRRPINNSAYVSAQGTGSIRRNPGRSARKWPRKTFGPIKNDNDFVDKFLNSPVRRALRYMCTPMFSPSYIMHIAKSATKVRLIASIDTAFRHETILQFPIAKVEQS